MIARKKILAFLLLMMLCFVLPIELVQTAKEPDSESGVKLVPSGIEQASEEYIDTIFAFQFNNEDVNETTITEVEATLVLEYNVTYEIISIDKGEFDDARIVNSTAIRFEASEMIYGANNTGNATVRLFNSSRSDNSGNGVSVDSTGTVKGKVSETEFGYNIEKNEWSITTTLKDLKKFGIWAWLKLISFKDWIWETFFPEFPAGNLIALGTGMGILIIFLFRRKKLRAYTF